MLTQISRAIQYVRDTRMYVCRKQNKNVHIDCFRNRSLFKMVFIVLCIISTNLGLRTDIAAMPEPKANAMVEMLIATE